jgi:hypothetical protein
MKRKLLESDHRNLNFIKEMLLKAAILEMRKDDPLSKKELALINTIAQVYYNRNRCMMRIQTPVKRES